MMYSLLPHIIIPFALSALIVILITLTAERYGTKIGGIIGTLPSTIIIAFFFIAQEKGIPFSVQSVTIVPAEMGLNLLFLVVFAAFATRGAIPAVIISLSTWTILTSVLFLLAPHTIIISLFVYLIVLFLTLLYLDKYKKISAQSSIRVSYTPRKILLRGLIAGSIIALAVSLSNIDAALSGIFSVFPAIFLSTMIISLREHGPDFTCSLAKGMIYGSPSVVTYAVGVYYFYPAFGIITGSIASFLLAAGVSVLLYSLRKKVQ